MMKETNFGPLLLLLLIALTPRNSCANPIASTDGTTEGADASMPIAEDMKERTNKLAFFMTLLQDNKLSSQFDQSILDLEKNILNLSNRLIENRAEILTEFYTSQNRITLLRSLLKQAASTLIEHCNTLLAMYNENDCSVEVISFSAKQFVRYANNVKDTLQNALNITIEIDDKLAAAEAFLKVLNATLEEETTDIKAKQEAAAAGDIQRLETDLENEKKAMENTISCIFTGGLKCTITIIFANQNIQNAREKAVADRIKLESQFELQKPRNEEIDKRCKLLSDIKSAQHSATTLLSHVKDVQQYLETEIDLIIKWQGPLATAITENTNITIINIKFNIKGIKKSLNNLKDACDAYLVHKLPDVLKS